MKKMIMAVAIVCAAAFANAAAVGWSVATGSAAYAGNTYKFFVIGQNGVADITTVTALLDAGSSVDTYAFGSGTIAASGSHTATSSTTGKTLGAGTYQSFVVLFDATEPVAGTSKYVVIDGLANQTKTVTSTAANVTFATGSAAAITGNPANWKSFGSAGPIAPEPTSGLLLLVGMAGLALKRKVA